MIIKRELNIVIGTLEIGGTERHLTQTLPSLVKLGWVVRVFTLTHQLTLAPILQEAGIEVIPPPQWLERLPTLLCFRLIMRILVNIIRLRKSFKKHRNEIFHFFLPEAYALGMIASCLLRFSGRRVMSRRSLNYYQKARPGFGWLECHLHRLTDLILCNSHAIEQQLVKEERVPSDKVKTIYNGIDLTAFDTPYDSLHLRSSLNIAKDSLVLVIVANLIPYKGHKDLLTALSLIKDQLPQNWRLICIGRDSKTLEEYKNLSTSLGLESHILWLGSRQDIPALLCMSNIGLLCSHEEGFSNAILESMAAGLPMVVTNVGGNPEAIQDGINGFIVPPKDPASLGAAILKLAKNPELCQQFSKANRSRVQSYFSLDKCVSTYNQEYEKLLGYQ